MTSSRPPALDPVRPADRLDAKPKQGPCHVAIIMDGNGRWATSRGLPRTEGHRQGVDIVRRTVRRAVAHGIGYLTLFSFSSENWRRPIDEVSYLLGLIKFFIHRELTSLHASNLRIRMIGSEEGVPADIVTQIHDAEALTRNNTGLTLVVAFYYGSRREIVNAARALAERVAAGTLRPDEIDEDMFARHLDTVGIPDPDLIIRTSGEQRLSNFLLWQAAYAEFVFEPTLWPDFDEAVFDRALAQYHARDRRFGAVAARLGG